MKTIPIEPEYLTSSLLADMLAAHDLRAELTGNGNQVKVAHADGRTWMLEPRDNADLAMMLVDLRDAEILRSVNSERRSA